MEDLDAPLVAAFLDHLEHDRGNSVRSRNARLAAIHSLFSKLPLCTACAAALEGHVHQRVLSPGEARDIRCGRV
jgi:hypothetical protein